MPAEDLPPGYLNADEYALVAYCGSAVGYARDPSQRTVARSAAVAAARRYHDRGVSWTEIARALGVSAGTLRDWRGDETGLAKRRAWSGSGPAQGTPAWRGDAPSHRRDARRLVLIALGAINRDTGNFPGEAAAIRRVLQPQGIEVMERCAIELGELKQDLDDLQPTVLHVAAHVEYGLVHLSAEDAKVSAVTGYDLGAAIRNANVPPALVVLSGCDTGTVCQMLTGPGHLASGIPVPAATGWHGNLNDRQARLFTERFYARLAAGATVNEAFDGPFITVTTRWPGQAQYLSGNAVMVPFPAGPALSE